MSSVYKEHLLIQKKPSYALSDLDEALNRPGVSNDPIN